MTLKSGFGGGDEAAAVVVDGVAASPLLLLYGCNRSSAATGKIRYSQSDDIFRGEGKIERIWNEKDKKKEEGNERRTSP